MWRFDAVTSDCLVMNSFTSHVLLDLRESLWHGVPADLVLSERRPTESLFVEIKPRLRRSLVPTGALQRR